MSIRIKTINKILLSKIIFNITIKNLINKIMNLIINHIPRIIKINQTTNTIIIFRAFNKAILSKKNFKKGINKCNLS